MPADAAASTITGRLDKLYEFERAPVTPDKLQSGRHFAGLFAGEHVAATEFIIGAMFKVWGASAFDIVVGLLIGNALAVLSWAFICAPIAVRTRLTLYWYVRRIIGPGLTVVYNSLNGVLYCCLAAAMIGVSASAVFTGLRRLGVEGLKHPLMTDVLPNSPEWVIVVLVVGAIVVALAIAGFKRLSEFASICSPWMFMIFIVGALATLPKLGQVHSLGDLYGILDTKVFTGVAPPGKTRLGFMHILFFAWFCNLAMHVGLSDMAVFRYARTWKYGFYSAFGMYLGHYLAWICAGIMGAAIMNAVEAGEMADTAAGVAGIIAVLLAGWTTANPTIYRAGLALQVVTPNWARWKVTAIAGAITTVVGFFPAIYMKLLSFVAIYGLMLMPIGAVIVVEHWLFPVLRLPQYWAERRKLSVNPAALIAWLVVLVLCFPIEMFTDKVVRSPMDLFGVHLFFRWLPGWFIAAGTYVLLTLAFTRDVAAATPVVGKDTTPAGTRSGAAPAGTQPGDAKPGPHTTPAHWAGGAVAIVSLLVSVALAVWVFTAGVGEGEANLSRFKTWLLVLTIAYFVGAIVWNRRHRSEVAPG